MTEVTQPFLKWAGGKRWLVTSRQICIPSDFGRYIEPFLGGGAVFFSVLPQNAILSDLNADLIKTYGVVRDCPNELQDTLIVHEANHSSEHYYAVRSQRPCEPVAFAARFIYLNRTCWNGLYRVNRRGEFNVPIGSKSKVAFENDELLKASKALKSAHLKSCDFERTIDTARCGDLLFVDPPYTANHNFNGFLKYNESMFSWSDQIRLRDALTRAASRGARIIVTNADHASVRELYDSKFAYVCAERASVLSGTIDGRKKTTEAIFLANVEAPSKIVL